MTIVRTHYRYKRPSRKRKAIALEVPAIVPAKKPKARKAPVAQPAGPAVVSPAKRTARADAANDDRKSAAVRKPEPQDSKPSHPVDVAAPSATDRKSAIVTARRPLKLYGETLSSDAPEPKDYEATTARFRSLITARLKKRP